MTDEQINIAIAESLGWKLLANNRWTKPCGIYADLPNYTSDLNVMHEAEKVLAPEQWLVYHGHLADATGFSYDDTMSTKEAETEWMHRVCHAPARQRCEAYLRTIGKWIE